MPTKPPPRVLLDKHAQVMREMAKLAPPPRSEAPVQPAAAPSDRLEELMWQRRALCFAIQLVDPDWVEPLTPPRKHNRFRWPKGALTTDALTLLKLRGPLWTQELLDLVAVRRRIRMTSREEREKLLSPLFSTLKNHLRYGTVQVLEREGATRNVLWVLTSKNIAPLEGSADDFTVTTGVRKRAA